MHLLFETFARFRSTLSWRRNRTNVASEARSRFSTLSWYINPALATVSRRCRFFPTLVILSSDVASRNFWKRMEAESEICGAHSLCDFPECIATESWCCTKGWVCVNGKPSSLLVFAPLGVSGQPLPPPPFTCVRVFFLVPSSSSMYQIYKHWRWFTFGFLGEDVRVWECREGDDFDKKRREESTSEDRDKRYRIKWRQVTMVTKVPKQYCDMPLSYVVNNQGSSKDNKKKSRERERHREKTCLLWNGTSFMRVQFDV